MDDNQNSMTAGEFGPILLQDFHLLDKLRHFDSERTPERVVHAKGGGAHGYFGKLICHAHVISVVCCANLEKAI